MMPWNITHVYISRNLPSSCAAAANASVVFPLTGFVDLKGK